MLAALLAAALAALYSHWAASTRAAGLQPGDLLQLTGWGGSGARAAEWSYLRPPPGAAKEQEALARLAGPSAWHRMRDDKGALLFPECAGAAQSPIDLPVDHPPAGTAAGAAGTAAVPRALDLSLPAAPLRLASQHTGFGGAVYYPLQESNVTWRLGGEQLHLLQFHFHARSEHTLGGRALAMELHLVFFKHGEASPRAVLGILYGAAPAPNAALEGLWAHLHRSEHHAHGNKLPVAGLLHLHALLADTQQRYYRYAGSLTTPPCSEGVDWHVLVSSVGVSEAQRAAFAESLPGPDALNYREVQPLGGRRVEVLDKSQDHFIEEIQAAAE